MTTQQQNSPANSQASNGSSATNSNPKVPAVAPIKTLHDMLKASEKQIQFALPKHMTAERMIRVALTAIQRTPKLLECTPMSVLSCVMQASELGLELSGPLGHCYLIPRRNNKANCMECTFQIGYRGFVSLAFRSGQVSFFNAHEVRENDLFSYEYGTEQRLQHKPAMKDRGEVIGFYSVFRLKDGASDFEFMSHDDVIFHRNRYAQKPKYGDWVWETNFEEMGKKTLIRKLAKRAPISIELTQAAVADEYTEANVGMLDMAADPQLPPVGRQSLRELPQSPPDDQPEASTPEPAQSDASGVTTDGESSEGQAGSGTEEKPGRDRQEAFAQYEERIDSARGVEQNQRIAVDLATDRELLGENNFEILARKNDASFDKISAAANGGQVVSPTGKKARTF